MAISAIKKVAKKKKLEDEYVQASRTTTANTTTTTAMPQPKQKSTQITKTKPTTGSLSQSAQTTAQTRGLTFPSNHFSSVQSGSKSTNSNCFGSISLLQPFNFFPFTSSTQNAVLTHSATQDSIIGISQTTAAPQLPSHQTQTTRTEPRIDIAAGAAWSQKHPNILSSLTPASPMVSQGAQGEKAPQNTVSQEQFDSAIQSGNNHLNFSYQLENELDERYGDIDYARYIPEYQSLLKSIRHEQAKYQKQREFIENNYRSIPLHGFIDETYTAADHSYYEGQLRAIRNEMETYDRLCDGKADLSILYYYYEQIARYETILERPVNTRGAEYMDATLEQVIKGNYTDEVTGLGTATQIGLGLLNLDLPADIRDFAYDWTHLNETPWWQTALDTVAFLPLIGSLKYVDEIADAAKHSDEAADVLATAVRHADDLTDAGKATENAASAAAQVNRIDGAQAIDLPQGEPYNATRAAYADAANANGTVTYYRIQGGIGNKRSKYLISVNADGTIHINTSGNLNVSAYNTDHANYFSQKRPGEIEIVSFEVPRWFDDFVRETAIPQDGYKTNPLNQGFSAPKMTDLNQPGHTYEFPPIWIDWLEEHAFNATVIEGGLP